MESNLEVRKIEKELPALMEHVNQMQVKTIGDVGVVNELKQEIKKRRLKMYNKVHPPVEDANKAHKSAKKLENETLFPFDQMNGILTEKISDFYAWEEEKREEAQRKLDEIAKRAEEKRKAELERQAKRLEEKGNLKKAEEKIQEAEEVFIPPTVIPKIETLIKTENGKLSMVKDIDIEITNEMELAKEMVAGKIPLSCMEWKVGKIKSYCKSFKIKDGQIKGIRIKTKFLSRTLK